MKIVKIQVIHNNFGHSIKKKKNSIWEFNLIIDSDTHIIFPV